MPIHTVVFLDSTRSNADLAPLRAVSDGVFGTFTGPVGSTADAPNAYLAQEPLRLLGAVGASASVLPDGDLIQIYQPSMDITPANLHPVNAWPWPSIVSALVGGDHAPRLRAGEAFGARATGANTVIVVAWVGERGEPVPAGEAFLLRFTATVLLEAATWTRTAMTWQVPAPQAGFQDYLPAGRYHVLGMTAWSTGSEVVAARLILPNQVYRPGALVLASGRTIPPAFELDGSFGVWGWFEQEQPPLLEVFGLSGSVTISGYVKIVRASAQSVRAGGATWG